MDYKDYQKINQEYFWHKARNIFINIILSKYLKNNDKKNNILEIGCGTGYQSDIISRYGNYTGLEKNPEATEELKKINKKVINSNIEDYETEEKFETICLFDVLEHIKNDLDAIKKINFLLKNNGLFFITVPAKKILFSEHDLAMDHYRRYEKEELRDLLIKNNFVIKEIGHWNCLLFPLIFVFRIIKKIICKKNKNKQEHESDVQNLPKIINKILYSILIFENKLTKIGLKIPFGLSLYVVAQKKYEN